MRKQIAVSTSEHNTSQAIEVQNTTRHSLPTTLECDERHRDEDQPTQGRTANRAINCNDQSGNTDTQGLSKERRTEHPSPSRREDAVEGGEAQWAQTEPRNRDSGFDPAIIFGANETQTKIYSVAGLHAHEGAPYEDRGAVQEAGDDVTEYQDQVAICRVEVAAQVFGYPG